MIKRAKTFAVICALLAAVFSLNSAAATAQKVLIKCTSLGVAIYEPPEDNDWGYRYGPTILINSDKSIDVWASSVPRRTTESVGSDKANAWDSIRYTHSPDNGKTWTPWEIVLEPSPSTVDQYSTCDPGVFKLGSYYYIGYTSTVNPKGTQNNVFVCRSKNPDGPFEKWNGSGWGGVPKAVTNYTGDPNEGGCSMPSFLVKDNTIYMYYTYQDENGGSQRLKTAPADDANWPAKLKTKGDCVVKGGEGSPSDIKYCDKLGKFIGICAINMYDFNSYIEVYESTDGIHFTVPCKIKDNTKPYLHNAGISSKPDGHIDLSMQNYIGYAYVPNGGDPKWGWWATRLAPISITSVSAAASSSKAASQVSSSKASSAEVSSAPVSSTASSEAVSSAESEEEVSSIAAASSADSSSAPANTTEKKKSIWPLVGLGSGVVFLLVAVLAYFLIFKKKAE